MKGVISADYWRDRTRTGPTFHIDYVFVPNSATSLLRRVSVGSHAKWITTGLSDQAPLIVDFLPEFASTTGRKVNKLCKARGAGPPRSDGLRREDHYQARAQESTVSGARIRSSTTAIRIFEIINTTTMAAILSKPERYAKGT
jgi:hypothetical protein